MASGEVTITFAPKPTELLRNSLAAMSYYPRRLALHIAIPAAIGLAVATISNTDFATTWLLILGYLALYWILLVVRCYIGCRNWMARRPRTMTFNERGVSVKTDTGEHKYDWTAFSALRPRGKGHILMLARSRLFFAIPSRAFSSPGEEAECVEIVTNQLSALRGVSHEH
jgi:hypothetical protein